MPSLTDLAERVVYDRDTGNLTWRVRPASMFRTPGEAERWNRLFAGKPAFNKPDKDGYLRGEINIDGERYRLRAHRVAYFLETGATPDLVDHKNGAVDDNKFDNLRPSDERANRRNSAGKKGRELPKCVEASGKRFRARTVVRGVKYDFGTYDTAEQASLAYVDGVRALHGEFGRGIFF
ncbi:MAG: HNH endonuclease [Methylorubrum rhodinum]|uniref:HNH endonuclease n=1 Tax=Methylorubrum rhodinum TaxID=29428 RepID=UPI003BB14BAC